MHVCMYALVKKTLKVVPLLLPMIQIPFDTRHATNVQMAPLVSKAHKAGSVTSHYFLR